MQNIPKTSSSTGSALGDALFAQANQRTSATESFEDALLAQHEAQQKVDQGQYHSVTAAMVSEQQSSEPLQEAPYSVKSKTDSGTYTLEEVTFTKTELVELRQDLVKAGAPEETLEKFDKLVNQPDGATLSQVMASLQQPNTPPKLTDNEKNSLKSLLQKIDNTGALEEKFMGLMDAGNGQAAWKLLSQAVSAMDPSARLSIDKSEAAVLGKALGLSTEAQSRLLKSFGGMQSLDINPNEFLTLMGPAQTDLADKAVKQAKLDKALDATLNPILQKARKRMEAEKEAAELESRKAQQSKIMINKTVTTDATNTVEKAAIGNNDQVKNQPNDKADVANGPTMQTQADSTAKTLSPKEHANTEQKGEGIVDLKTQLKGQQANETVKGGDGTEQNAQGKNSKQDTAHRNGNELLRDPGQNNADGRDPSTAKGSGWESLLNKVEVRGNANTNNANTLAGLQGITNPTGLVTPGTNAAVAGGSANISRQVASQVEQAMLNAMRDGSKKLELQLTPGDLGTMTLTLTARNGEVSAIIRSERPETAELMTRQLDVLRTNLEQQGIKIDKLEVQTQTGGQQGSDAWQGMNQHNTQQEEHARREQLDRIRNLGRMRNSSTSENLTHLEQGMQSMSRTAENAAQSLHIVA